MNLSCDFMYPFGPFSFGMALAAPQPALTSLQVDEKE